MPDTMTPAVHPGLGGDDEAPSESGIDGINKSAPFDRGADAIRALCGPHHNNLSLQNDVDPTTTTTTTTTTSTKTTTTTTPTEASPTTAAAAVAAAAATTLALAGASPASTCFPSPPSDTLRDTLPWTSSAAATVPSAPAPSIAASVATLIGAAKEPLPDANRQHQQPDLQLQPRSRSSRLQSDLASKSQPRSQSQPPLGLDSEPEPEPELKPKPNSKPKPNPESEPEPVPPATPPSEPRAPRPRNHLWSADSHDSIPTQTIVKALASIASASVSPGSSPPPPLPPLLQNMTMCPRGTTASSSAIASPQQLAEALQDLANKRAASGSAIANMLSPCFYHQRFDDAVDIDRVLDEIQSDEAMSHCRLAQTAASVREVSKQLRRRPIRRAVRSIMIVTKARDNQLVYHTRELATWLLQTPRYGSDVGVNVYVDAKLRASKRFDAAGIVAMDPRFEDMLKYWTPDLCWSQPEKFDLVLTLGGDGTVLFTSWLFQRIVPPVLSFSLGSLGFMTTFEFEKYKKHLDRVMGDDGMKVNLRMRFTCTVWRSGSKDSKGFPMSASGNPMDEGEQFEVLNELVIDRGPSPYVSNLELYGDDELLTVVQADGCIFSTPTGSTAYSLSAGGSLVHPDIPAILLTPICPHTLSFRPMVLSDTMALRVVVPRNSRATAYCAFDGKGRIELRQGDHVTITASQYPFPTVTRTDTEWFDSVSRTLRWNVRAAAQKPFSDNGDEDDCASWDIDTDSAYYASEEGSEAASPVRRQMSMLGL